MKGTEEESYPLPDHPALAEVAAALRNTGHWAIVVDDRWRVVYVTDELRLSFGNGNLVDFPIGVHMFGPEVATALRDWRFGMNSAELHRMNLAGAGGLVLNDTPGGRDELAELVDPSMRDLVDELTPVDSSALSFTAGATGMSGKVHDIPVFVWRVRDHDGRLAGTAMITKPEPGMTALSALGSNSDPRHLDRMQHVARAGRRPAAVLFADLEASSPLARQLSTASYFALNRRLVRAADQCVIDAGGLVGRHVGDGVVAFFLAEISGSESAAARACISAARALGHVLNQVAESSDLEAGEVVLRFGLHWGSTVYVGSIVTGGRSEVTALGDEVNEAARIEACAGGGRTLASKSLVERLDPEDAMALSLDPDHITYAQLGELDTATEKARRDAPAIAVCDVQER